jgi:hypothetical protein
MSEPTREGMMACIDCRWGFDDPSPCPVFEEGRLDTADYCRQYGVAIRTCISEYFRMKEEMKNLKYLSGNWLNNSLVFKPSDLCRGAEKILTRIRDYGKEDDDEWAKSS